MPDTENNSIVSALDSHSKSEIVDALFCDSAPKCRFSTRYSNRRQIITSTDSPSATDPQYASMCDINAIVARHMITGQPLPSIDEAIYGFDGTQSSFEDFVLRLDSAKKNFNSLPSSLRAEFDNDVSLFANYLKSATDDDLQKLKVKHGLVTVAETPAAGVSSHVDYEPTPINPNKPDVSVSAQ